MNIPRSTIPQSVNYLPCLSYFITKTSAKNDLVKYIVGGEQSSDFVAVQHGG